MQNHLENRSLGTTGRFRLESILEQLLIDRGAEMPPRSALTGVARAAARAEEPPSTAPTTLGAVHDLGNLLTIVLGYGETLRNLLEPLSSERRQVEEICEAARHAFRLTLQLLAEVGPAFTVPVTADVRGLLEDLEPTIRALLGPNILWSSRVPPGLPALPIPTGATERILVDLGMAARDRASGTAHLELIAEEIQLSEAEAASLGMPLGPCLWLQVRDRTSQDDRASSDLLLDRAALPQPKKLLDPEVPVVHGVIRLWGGALRSHDRTELGPIVSAYLPVLPRSESAGTEQDRISPDAAHGLESILLVENNDGVRRLMAEILERHGYRVQQASDARSARALVQAPGLSLDLLIAEMRLPDGRAPDLAQHLTQSFPSLKVLYTAGSSVELPPGPGGMGPEFHLLRKPFTPDCLVSMVREVLEQASCPS